MSHSVSPVVVPFQPGQRDDVAGKSLGDLLLLVGVHHHHAADALAPGLGRIQELAALLQLAGIDPGEGERPHERVVHDLESEAGERLGIVGAALDVPGLGLVARLEADVGGHVERARQVIDNRVKKRLHSLVLESRTA